MLSSLYIGTSALLASSQALENTSHNIANLNTLGYKSTQLQFAAQFSQGQQQGSSGSGVSVLSSVINFKGGDLASTGGDLDLAVDGAGFFILKDDNGAQTYTRNGQFHFNDSGILVSMTGKRVQGYNGSGKLGDITIAGMQASTARATTKIEIPPADRNNTATLSINQDADHPSTSTVTVYDAAGGTHTLTITYTNQNPTHVSTIGNKWKVEVRDEANVLLGSEFLVFGNDASTTPDHTSFNLSYTPVAAPAMAMTLYYTGLKTNSGSGTSTSPKMKGDGYSAGSLSTKAFGADGVLELGYDNGQSDKRQRVALAKFTVTDQLRQVENGEFVSADPSSATLGTSGNEFGKVTKGKLEKANVELSSEFSEMIVQQRMYQAASSIVSAVDKMLGQAIDMKGRG